VQDFRQLNAQSQDDRFSMKDKMCALEVLDVQGPTYFMHMTAFTAPRMGQFEWIMSPMGLLGCPGSFQRLLEMGMYGLVNVIVYIDDILLHSKNHLSIEND
jgi:hypothetical protein